jgi:DNA-binding transcriptional regulator YdaS (Cro superfamily)
MLAVLADPRVTGMPSARLQQMCAQLAPAQAAVAEQRKYLQRGGARRQASGDHGRPLLTPADQVLITVVYLRRVCSQKVLVELLGTNPVTIGQAIKQTRLLIDEQNITASQTPHYFARAQDLRDWLDHGTGTPQMQISQALAHPELTGMSREDFQTLVERITIPYLAAIERRRHQHRGGDRLPGTRGGVFRQKITDADRILATVLAQRQLCDQQVLADLFAVSRGTIRNAIDDVVPLLDQNGYTPNPAAHQFATATEILTFVTPIKTTDPTR